MTRPRARAAAALAAAALAAASGCPDDAGPPGPGLTDATGRPALEGAATEIPLYEPCRVDDRLDVGSLDGATHTYTWFVEVDDPVAEVAAFYRSELHADVTEEEGPDGAVAFHYRPLGGDDRERVAIYVREGEVEITETVSAELHGQVDPYAERE